MLARLVERPMPLKARYKGKEFRASLRRDGHIQFKRTPFESRSAAARAAVGRGMRGWLFSGTFGIQGARGRGWTT